MSSDIYLNGITYPADRKVAFPGKDGKPVVFSLPEDADAGLNAYSERPVQNKVIHAAITAEAAARAAADEEIRQHLTSPYNFKGSLASASALPAASAANANDTYYLIAEKYRVTSDGTAWKQSSMEESQYTDELGAAQDDINALTGVLDTQSFADEIYGHKYTLTFGYYTRDTGQSTTVSQHCKTNILSKFGGRTLCAKVSDTNLKLAARFWDEGGVYVPSRATDYKQEVLAHVPDGWTVAFNFKHNDTSSFTNEEVQETVPEAFSIWIDGGEFNAGTLDSAVDFNNVKAPGTYRVASTQTVANPHQPSDEYGRLIVFAARDQYSCVQLYVTYTNKIYSRFLAYLADDTWTEWALCSSPSVFQNRSVVRNADDAIDFDLMTVQGRYGLSNTQASQALNSPSPYEGHLLVFAGTIYLQVYVNYFNTVYYRTKSYAQDAQWTEWLRPLKPDTTLTKKGAAADARTTGGLWLHDGQRYELAEAADPIPVDGDHLGYNAFISSTWDTLLPDGYQDGDDYDAATTKIINVDVQRESLWRSTAYGINQDRYRIYRYTFTPTNGYQRTVLLTAGCHGNEAEAYWGLYRLIRRIYFEGYKYPALRHLRQVRFIIVPSWNPWGMQHFRRYNAFSALNTETDLARNLQAWNWLMADDHKITVNNVEYDISDVGEASVIWDTLNDFDGELDLWIDYHTDPYAGRTTHQGEIDDPRGYTPPYGIYGFVRRASSAQRRLVSVAEDYYNILRDVYGFDETWHFLSISPNASGSSGFAPWMASLSFPTALVEVSTHMTGFPAANGSGEMMRLAEEFYGACLAELAGLNGWE